MQLFDKNIHIYYTGLKWLENGSRIASEQERSRRKCWNHDRNRRRTSPDQREKIAERLFPDVVFISQIVTISILISKIHELTNRTYLKSLLLLRLWTPLASPSRDPLFLFTDRSVSAVRSSLFSLSITTRTTLSSEIAPSDGFQSAASFAAEGNNAPRFLRRCLLVVIGARDLISSAPGAAVASGLSMRDMFTGTQQETNSKRNFIGN